MNLNGQGWSLADLAGKSREAGIHSVVDILAAYCEEEGML